MLALAAVPSLRAFHVHVDKIGLMATSSELVTEGLEAIVQIHWSPDTRGKPWVPAWTWIDCSGRSFFVLLKKRLPRRVWETLSPPSLPSPSAVSWTSRHWLSSSHRYVRTQLPRPCPGVGPSTELEVKHVSSLLLYLAAVKPSLSGDGAVWDSKPLEDVHVASHKERRGFYRNEGRGAREDCFPASGFRLRGSGNKFAGQSCRLSIPASPNSPRLSSRITSGSLSSQGHGSTTMMLEATALARGVQALVSRHGLNACRLQAIVDNMATCLAFGRLRSGDKHSLRIRKLSAWCLARSPSASSGPVRGESSRQAISSVSVFRSSPSSRIRSKTSHLRQETW